MTLKLGDFEAEAREAVKIFWGNRDAAMQKQIDSGNVDAGTRGAVTAGKNMVGFDDMIERIVRDNGPADIEVHAGSRTALPGFFRATKNWDILVMRGGRLVAAIEAKSQVGSIGKNQNNRSEEAIGSAKDFRTAYRESGFGKNEPPPMLGYLLLVEDSDEANRVVEAKPNHFDAYPEFQKASYLERYHILCQKLAEEQLYDAACVLHSKQSAAATGEYGEHGEMSSLRNFVATLAAHMAKEASREPPSGNRQTLFT